MRLLVSVFLALACAATAAQADFDADSYPRYETCALCHGLFGQSRLNKFPHLAGQKPAYIQAQLDAFLSGERTNDGGQMSSVVTELQPEDFAVVVAWFSEQPPPDPFDAPQDDTGQRLTEEAGCLSCHTGDITDDVPHLSAQHPGYLAKQMHDFLSNRRTNSEFAQMHANLLADLETGIDDIAAYLASLERPG
ncbi:MAG: c-type cytochrome [Pseudomonadota bacterium]